MAKINFNNIKYEKSYGTAVQLEKSTKPEIAFIGKSNVGKSSLLNKLCNNKKLAKVSSTPGKTTTINFFNAGDVYLVDLPGYGFAKRSNSEIKRWTELINEYFYHDRQFALVVCLLDIRHNPTSGDCEMLEFIHNIGLPFMIALTKADKLSKQKQAQAAKNIKKFIGLDGHIPVIATSSESGIGIPELKNALENAV